MSSNFIFVSFWTKLSRFATKPISTNSGTQADDVTAASIELVPCDQSVITLLNNSAYGNSSTTTFNPVISLNFLPRISIAPDMTGPGLDSTRTVMPEKSILA